jgi:SAM-dependent methyltransferase
MADKSSIISLAQWLHTPAGIDLLAWEQQQLDAAVADLFGFHALQLGMPALQGLRDNRMPHRWLAVDALDIEHAQVRGVEESTPSSTSPLLQSLNHPSTVEPWSRSDAFVPSLVCDFDALPLDAQSLDLVVLPHSLELAEDPHRALGEVDRVLRPEGHAVILGFNPTSLWGLRQRLGHVRRSLGLGKNKPLFMPRAGEFIGYRRLRDWLRLLSFDVVSARFGCYRPPLTSPVWLERCAWMDRVGERWWPVFGSVYMVVVVKRVRGMRLVGLAPQTKARKKAVPAVVAHHRKQTFGNE